MISKLLKTIASEPILCFCKYFGGDGFYTKTISIKTVFKCFIVQKIIGVNRHVNWPVHHGSEIICPEKIERGSRYPGLARYCFLDGRNGIKIGDNTWIGPHVSIISMNHDPHDLSKYLNEEPVVIGSNCWLCAYSIVLPGVTLADNIVVAANAVVTKSCKESHVVLAGNPARPIKSIGNKVCAE
jgi:acetyltransferase-like isoleucine patch superfamily enzyme